METDRTCGICASGISHDLHRRDTPGRGKRHNQERGTQKSTAGIKIGREKGEDGVRRK